MVFLTENPQRMKLLKAVRETFEEAGWTINPRRLESHDLRVDSNKLRFLIKCIDSNPIGFNSSTEMVRAIDHYARECRNLRGQQLVVIFDRNWLGIPLESLMEQEIFAIEFQDIGHLTTLSGISAGIPKNLNATQDFLVSRCAEYASFVARQYRQAGEINLAIEWARRGKEHTPGYSNVYLQLFSLLIEIKDFESATTLGKEIVGYRPDDSNVIRAMARFARLRGDRDEAERWLQRLAEERSIPHSLEDILAKQQLARSSPKPKGNAGPDVAEKTTPHSETEKGKKTSRFFRIFGLQKHGSSNKAS